MRVRLMTTATFSLLVHYVVLTLFFTFSLSINNAIKGQPVISCGSRSISVTVQTEHAFAGKLYVKGFFHIPECQVNGSFSTTTAIEVPVASMCGLRRRRVMNPRGILLDATVVMMFHPIFMTQIDKVYHVQCNYMESNSAVTRTLDVSMRAPTELPEGLAKMDGKKTPACKYEVLNNDQNGVPVTIATVGDLVYHKWTCESDNATQYCMTVHSCTADDGQGSGQQLIDDKGCSLDSFLLDNLEYGSDMMVGQKAHVFKFADKPTIFFSCLIRLEFKEDTSSKCNVPSQTCNGLPRNDSLRTQLSSRITNSIPQDFPKPPTIVSNQVVGEDGGVNVVDNIMSGDDKDNYYHFRKAREASRFAFDMDVAAPSVEVIELPDYGRRLNASMDSSSSELLVCVSRLSLGLCFCMFAVISTVSVYFYMGLSSRLLQAGSRIHRQLTIQSPSSWE